MNENSKNEKLKNLNDFLIAQSKDICQDNDCSEDNHYCDSYAYINKEYDLLDICISDYFQGSSKPCAAISLPWNQDSQDLKNEIDNQIGEFEL